MQSSTHVVDMKLKFTEAVDMRELSKITLSKIFSDTTSYSIFRHHTHPEGWGFVRPNEPHSGFATAVMLVILKSLRRI